MSCTSRRAPAVLMIVGALAVFQAHTDAQTLTLLGRITDDSGRPLSGATIEFVGIGAELRAANMSVYADATGHYMLDAPAARGTLSVSAPGFTTARVRITPAIAVPIDVQLTPSRALTGRIILTGPASAPPTARIRAIQSGRMMSAVTVEAALDGTFSIDGLSSGVVELVAWAEGYASEEIEVDVSGAARPIVMVLKPLVVLSGRIRDQFGELKGGVELELDQPAPRKGQIHVVDLMKPKYVTDSTGRYRLRVAPGRPGRVSVRSTGCAEQSLEATVLELANEITLFCNK